MLIDISRSVGSLHASREPSLRTVQTAAMFGLSAARASAVTIVPGIRLPLPIDTGGLVYITGPSGSGKSTLLRSLAQRCREEQLRIIDMNALHLPARLALIDGVGATLEHASSLLALVGLADAFTLLHTPAELSEGQLHRFRLACALEAACRNDAASTSPAIIIADEFASALDRVTAQVLARNVKRCISQTPRPITFIAASAHEDIAAALDPDVLVLKGFQDDLRIIDRRPPLEPARATKTVPSARRAKTRRPNRAIRTTPPQSPSDTPHPSHHGLLDMLHLEPGSPSDYRALARFHYRSRPPRTFTTVYRIVYRPRHDSGILAIAAQEQVVGVLTRSLPALHCRARDLATHARYAGLTSRERGLIINREVRTISRVVIDPRFRGLGLAVRLVRHALNHPEPGTIWHEAFAAMGRVHPFFERAGMQRHDAPPTLAFARLADALHHAGLDSLLSAPRADLEHAFNALSNRNRSWLLSELRLWHRDAHRVSRAKREAMPPADLLVAARDALFSRPVYYLKPIPVSPRERG